MKQEYAYCGIFTYHWNHPPAPFNPHYDPGAKARYAEVTASMEADNFYADHSREECKNEWGKRYANLKEGTS